MSASQAGAVIWPQASKEGMSRIADRVKQAFTSTRAHDEGCEPLLQPGLPLERFRAAADLEADHHPYGAAPRSPVGWPAGSEPGAPAVLRLTGWTPEATMATRWWRSLVPAVVARDALAEVGFGPAQAASIQGYLGCPDTSRAAAAARARATARAVRRARMRRA